jgi:signal transduction histidine kinase
MRSDGTVFPVESSLQAMDIGGERYYQAIIRDITDRKTIERELQRRMEQLHSLAAQLQEAREEERGALARELHDELAQTMTALKMDLAMLKTEVAGRPAGDAECRETVLKSIEEMTDLVQETIALVRRMITELRPGVLDQLGLADALAWQAEEFQKRNGIPCFLETSGGTSLDKRRSVAVFRVFQEALTNIARHAAATRVTVSLEEVEGIVRLRVSDDGRGLPSDFMTGGGGFGLIGMRERALMLGGKLDISSRPGQGTTIELSIPAGWEQGGGP